MDVRVRPRLDTRGKRGRGEFRVATPLAGCRVRETELMEIRDVT